MSIAIEFCIFELVYVPNFSLNLQFDILDQICPKRVFPIGNGKIALVRASMVIAYYIKLFRTGADRHNGILMSLLLLVAETIKVKTDKTKPNGVEIIFNINETKLTTKNAFNRDNHESNNDGKTLF